MVVVLVVLPCVVGNVDAAGFQPWELPGLTPSPPAPWRFDPDECHRALIGGAVGGLIGGAIGSRIGRHGDNGRSRIATTAFGSFIGYVIGSQIGRSMDQADTACSRPPQSIRKPPPLPNDGSAIRI